MMPEMPAAPRPEHRAVGRPRGRAHSHVVLAVLLQLRGLEQRHLLERRHPLAHDRFVFGGLGRLDVAVERPRQRGAPGQVVVLHGIGDDRGRNRPVDPGRHVLPQFHRIGKGRLQAAVNGVFYFRGVAVGQLKGDEDGIVTDQGNDAHALRRIDRRDG